MFIFAASLFFSSLLLFQIQPLISKYILPWFGSSPAVWSASLLFFQVLLTAGYAYAYGVIRFLSTRRLILVHTIFLVIVLIFLAVSTVIWGVPLLPNVDGIFSNIDITALWNNPFWFVVIILSLAVGLPYLLLATNSILVQAWFSQRFPGRSPYRLFALSNTASLIGLVSYPFIIEPYLSIKIQAVIWCVIFVIFLILTARLLFLGNLNSTEVEAIFKTQITIDTQKPKGRFEKILWVFLPAVASTLLLATTNQITQEVAVIPFLWVLPLSLYLISFILCFEGDRWYGRIRFTVMLGLAFAVYGLTMSQGPLVDFRVQIATYCLLLFVVCMICHGELARLRPESSSLPQYYLLLSLGGALGSVFVNLIAPVIFVYYWEFPTALVTCLLLCVAINWLVKPKPIWYARVLSTIFFLGIGLWFVKLEVDYAQDILYGSEWIERNFFGVMRVKEIQVAPDGDPAYQFVHGITIHGVQFIDPEKRQIKTTYYTESSGAGLAFLYHPDRENSLNVGILGLGIGTQAAYGREGDFYRFYEINPAVISIANGYGGYYSYLSDSDAEIEIVLGDARVSLERELSLTGSNQFDLLVLDTFSSDAIPVHLITQQAFRLYLEHLTRDGILAIHISNNHLDLKPVVWGLAQYFHLESVQVISAKSDPGSSTSVWMLLTRNQEFLNHPAIRAFRLRNEDIGGNVPLWTDDFSNLFSILK